MLVIDFMHEFELGVWKLFLIRVLYAAAAASSLVEALNER
jgi:hypothetical protein